MRKLGIACMLLGLATVTHAKTIDPCRNIIGAWKGTFTIKNLETCRKLHGCTHGVTADVTYLSDIDYQMEIKPAVGQGGMVYMRCFQGQMIRKDDPAAKVSLHCYDVRECYVAYDDAKLSSSLVRLG